MRIWTLLTLVSLVALAVEQRPAAQAQTLTFSLFERYLDALRQQAGIPGLSAAIVQNRRVAWQASFGQSDIESSTAARPDTPYLIGDLTQTFAVVLLGQCAEGGRLNIDEPVSRWTSSIPESGATVRHLLAHASNSAARGFQYDPERYASLTPVAEACTRAASYRQALAAEVLDRLGMADSVPGTDLADAQTVETLELNAAAATRYAAVLGRVATPYRVDRNGRATRLERQSTGINAAVGLISTVRDLARYDAALDDGDLVRTEVLSVAWRNVTMNGTTLPTGLGWFVQTYNGERLVWHFGMTQGFSSLMLKVPARDLTLILLANSDGLSATFSLAQGDVTRSLFARTFLRFFL